MNQTSLAPWRSLLAKALHKNRSKPHHRYFQLATVDHKGHPSNRTVVFRGFLNQSDRLKIITDRRSGKMQHLGDRPQAEIAWYFTTTREQFRLAGHIETIDEHSSQLQHERQLTWQALSNPARQQFAWPEPGTPYASQREIPPVPAAPYQAHPNFVLLLFQPKRVEHLALRPQPHQRFCYWWHPEQGWHSQQLNP